MTPVAATKTTLKLNVPRQKLARLSYCETKVDAMREWIAGLPVANVAETAMRLYRAIAELNQLQAGPETRFALLEALRGTIHSECASLSRTFLQGPLVLSGHAQHLADLVQALQNQLAMGYKIVVADGADARSFLGLDARPRRQTMAGALHRAISDLSRSILCSCQLYTQPPKELWRDLHQLYLFAEIKRMLDDEVQDAQNELMECTPIRHAYLRAALLGCTKANTMRRHDLTHLFHVLEIWAPYTSVSAAGDDALFIVDLYEDAPPVYRALYQGDDLKTCRSLETRPLVERLNGYLHDGDGAEIPIPEFITPQIVDHAVHSWGNLARRAFSRAPAHGELEVCVGISSAHYHLAGEVEFGTLMGEGASDALNPFLRFTDGPARIERGPDDDAWSRAFDVGGARIPLNPNFEGRRLEPRRAEALPAHAHPTFATQLVDTSPGGYCVRWPQEVPANLQAGELLAIREHRADEWAVAVVRWLRNVRGEGTLMGIEFLAPRALAVGARVIRNKGGSTDYLRALLLPELEAIRQPAMLITPRLPFQTRQKIQLNQAGQQLTAQLTENVGSAEGFSQFRFRLLEEAPRTFGSGEEGYRGLTIEL